MRKTLIVLTALCAVINGFPGVAVASSWHLQPVDGTTTQKFTGTGGTSEQLTLNADHSIASKTHCTSSSLEGEYENTTTGWVQIAFHGCTGFGFACTTHEAPVTNGTIKTTKLTFHNVYINEETTKPGILITPNHTTKVFKHYTCGGGLVNVTIEGNGVVGTTTATCGTKISSTDLKFDKNATNTQLHSKITGVTYDLKRSTGATATQVGTGKVTLQKESLVNCT